jgi:hypothetical protein
MWIYIFFTIAAITIMATRAKKVQIIDLIALVKEWLNHAKLVRLEKSAQEYEKMTNQVWVRLERADAVGDIVVWTPSRLTEEEYSAGEFTDHAKLLWSDNNTIIVRVARDGKEYRFVTSLENLETSTTTHELVFGKLND